MKTDVFHLQILPLKRILPHETFDENRSKKLAISVAKDKMICNPIIVAPLTGENYVQLDGMNRLSTFRRMGFKSILCQIVDYQDMENVELSSWLHFINVNTPDFLNHINNIKNVTVKKGTMSDIRNRYIHSEGPDVMCSLITEKMEIELVKSGGSLIDKINALNSLVNYYSRDIARGVLPDQATIADVKMLFREHLKHNQMVVFPTFTRHQIIKVVKKGSLFPTGLTRHIIRRRCLNVNLPLTIFKENPIERQNRILEENLRKRKFRLYEEATIYFE